MNKITNGLMFTEADMRYSLWKKLISWNLPGSRTEVCM